MLTAALGGSMQTRVTPIAKLKSTLKLSISSSKRASFVIIIVKQFQRDELLKASSTELSMSSSKSSEAEPKKWRKNNYICRKQTNNNRTCIENKPRKMALVLLKKATTDIPAEASCVVSSSEKLNGIGVLALGIEMMTQSSTCPALSGTSTDVCSNPTTTSETEYGMQDQRMFTKQEKVCMACLRKQHA